MELRQRYSSNPISSHALEGAGRSAPRSGRFIPEKEPVLVAQVGWASEPVWKGMAKLVHHWEMIPRPFKATARRYTDYATLATNCRSSNITVYLTSYHNVGQVV